MNAVDLHLLKFKTLPSILQSVNIFCTYVWWCMCTWLCPQRALPYKMFRKMLTVKISPTWYVNDFVILFLSACLWRVFQNIDYNFFFLDDWYFAHLFTPPVNQLMCSESHRCVVSRSPAKEILVKTKGKEYYFSNLACLGEGSLSQRADTGLWNPRSEYRS